MGYYLAFCFVLVGAQSVRVIATPTGATVLQRKTPALETLLIAAGCVVGSLLHVVHWYSTDRTDRTEA